jgi:hypothetical protein
VRNLNCAHPWSQQRLALALMIESDCSLRLSIAEALAAAYPRSN